MSQPSITTLRIVRADGRPARRPAAAGPDDAPGVETDGLRGAERLGRSERQRRRRQPQRPPVTRALMPGTPEGARGCAARSPPTGAPRAGPARGAARSERVQERGRLAIEAAELEELRSVAAHASAHLGHELSFRELRRGGPGESSAAPHRHVGEERVAPGLRGGPLHARPATGQKARCAVAPLAHDGVDEDVGDSRAQLRQLAVAEARLRVVGAGEVAHGVEAVDRGGREVGIATADARHLVMHVLQRGARLDPAAQLAQQRGEAPVEGDLVRHAPRCVRRGDQPVDLGHRRARRLLQQERHAALEHQRAHVDRPLDGHHHDHRVRPLGVEHRHRVGVARARSRTRPEATRPASLRGRSSRRARDRRCSPRAAPATARARRGRARRSRSGRALTSTTPAPLRSPVSTTSKSDPFTRCSASRPFEPAVGGDRHPPVAAVVGHEHAVLLQPLQDRLDVRREARRRRSPAQTEALAHPRVRRIPALARPVRRGQHVGPPRPAHGEAHRVLDHARARTRRSARPPGRRAGRPRRTRSSAPCGARPVRRSQVEACSACQPSSVRCVP